MLARGGGRGLIWDMDEWDEYVPSLDVQESLKDEDKGMGLFLIFLNFFFPIVIPKWNKEK